MEKIILITNKTDLKSTLMELLSENALIKSEPKFEIDRINRYDACKLAGVSPPTFSKLVSKGIFKEHGYGRKKFFLKSEVIYALTKQTKKATKNNP